MNSMKKTFAAVISVLICISIISFCAFAKSDSSVSSDIKDKIENNPEVSSILDDAANGNINADKLKDALSQIEGVDLDQLMKGLEGLGPDDGVLGKISSIIGPDSDGLAGIISGIGNLGGGSGSGAGSSVEGILNNILNRFSGKTSENPTVHTTFGSYTEGYQNATIYTPNYNYTPNNAGNTVNFDQYTAPSVTMAIPEITTQSFTQAAPQTNGNISVAVPVENKEKSKANWKKAVGAVLVFGSFAGIAAIVIKKSM